MSLVVTVPNVSEGRRAEVIGELAGAFATSEVALLHQHPDVDHNRTVLTAAGTPHALASAVEELYVRAVEHIDLRQHRGVHPRVGAVDVCPFVPLAEHGSTMADCVALSRRVGERIAERLRLPVFLYRHAARAAHRCDLTAVRRGQFEGLAEKLADPAWKPDFGPPCPHPSAGATVIGARGPLIAFNVVLESDDLDAARQIAARVRESSGGLAGIKAMGVRLATRGLVQVSMNVEDPDTTPLPVVFEAVCAEAAARGCRVRESELVGLAPRGLLGDPARVVERYRLAGFGPEHILENAIASARLDGAGEATKPRR